MDEQTAVITRSRPALKQQSIEDAIRGWIIDGPFGPGTRLPRRVEIQERFDASRVTVQRVFDQLAAEGFVIASGRGGTCVAARPPHLHRIALVYPRVERWPRFWTALAAQAERQDPTGPWDVEIIRDLEYPTDTAGLRLIDDIRAQRLAGIVFASRPGGLVDSELLAAPVPRVALMAGPGLPGTPALYPDQQSFVIRALDHLLAQGCRRIGALVVPLYPTDMLLDEMRRRGQGADPRLLQAAPLDSPEWAEPLARLWGSADASWRPDGLIIADDNLVEPACAGLTASGCRIGEDLQVVAHCNFPLATASELPLRRLGFDSGECLSRCLGLIARQRSGEAVPQAEAIPARFSDEVPDPVGDSRSDSR